MTDKVSKRVAAPPTARVEEERSTPETWRLFEIVEEALEINPSFKLAKLATVKVLEAERGPVTFRELEIVEEPAETNAPSKLESPETARVLEADNGPLTFRFALMVEEAWEIKPLANCKIPVSKNRPASVKAPALRVEKVRMPAPWP